MPVQRLPENPNLDHLRSQAKDLLRNQAARNPQFAQRIREFHPRFTQASDTQIFDTPLSLSDAQLTIARQYGFPSWTRLKAHIEKPADRLDLPHHERILEPDFRQAVKLLDAGDTAGLKSHLKQHPNLVRDRVTFEGGNYFRNPTLLEFIAENPVRHGTLPENIVEVAGVILSAGAELPSIREALMLVSTGCVARQCNQQVPLIDLLCDNGADPDTALLPALLHGELEAVNALLARGARLNLPAAAALGRMPEVRAQMAASSAEDRHLALALGAQFGQTEVVRLLLDAGENPSRYNPPGGHSHCTPLHQAAWFGHDQVVRLLVERGADPRLRDLLWQGTPADWAHHAGRTELEAYLRGMEAEDER